MKKKLLSIILCLTMLVGLMPTGLFSLTASAEGESTTRPAATSDGLDYSGYKIVDVSTWDELDEALTAEGDAVVNVITDIHKHSEVRDAYGKGQSTQTIMIYGNKVIELNGHEIYNEDDSNASNRDVYCSNKWSEGTDITHTFTVTENANVIITDCEGGGKIRSNGYHIGFYIHNWEAGLALGAWTMGLSSLATLETGDAYNDKYYNYCYRDLFYVYGSLTVNGGTIDAGQTKNQWITKSTVNFGSNSDAKTGYYAQGVGGTAVAVFDGGQLTVNGGTIGGTGAGRQNNFRKYISDYQEYYEEHKFFDYYPGIGGDYHPAAAITVCKGSTVNIYDGEIIGYNGADAVLTGYTDYATQKNYQDFDMTVYGGVFRTKKNDRVRLLDDHIEDHTGKLEKIHERNILEWADGRYGNISIPLSAFKNTDTVINCHGDIYKPTDNYESSNDITVSRGRCSCYTKPKTSCDVLYKSDSKFLIGFTITGNKDYYPDDNEILTNQTTHRSIWTLTDMQDSSNVQKFTSVAVDDTFNLLAYIDTTKLVPGHKYQLIGLYNEIYNGRPVTFSVANDSYGVAEFTYSDAEFPDSSVFIYQNYNRSAASGVGTVDVYVQLRNVTNATKIEVTSPFSKKVYTKTVAEDGTYLFNLDEKEVTFGVYKVFPATITAIDSAGNTIKQNISANGLIAPWMYSSKTAKYTQENSVEKMIVGSTITLYSGFSGTTTIYNNYSFQWYSCDVSSNGTRGTATAISGATNVNYKATYSTDKEYYCVITQKASGIKAYSNSVLLTKDTKNYAAIIDTPDGTSASDTSPVTLTCNAYNYTGTLKYNWYIEQGPQEYECTLGKEISGITGAANRKSIEFPSAAYLKNKCPPGTYKIYCEVSDSGTGQKYRTPSVTINLDRSVGSVSVSDRVNGYNYKSGKKIFLPSENGTVALKTNITPVYANENYTVIYRDYDDEIIDVTEDGIIKAKNPGKTMLYADYYGEDESIIASLYWYVYVPISTVDITLYGKPTVNEYANYVALCDGYVYTEEACWYDADTRIKPSFNDEVFMADGKYGYRYGMSTDGSGTYYFPVCKYSLNKYYTEDIEIDINNVEEYINLNALNIRWHTYPENANYYLTSADTDCITTSVSGDTVYACYEFDRIYDKTKSYKEGDYAYFCCPEVGTTVNKLDIINAIYGYNEAFELIQTFVKMGIDDLTAKTYGNQTVTLQAGHQYRVYLDLCTKASLDSTRKDDVRFADDYFLYIDNQLQTIEYRSGSEGVQFYFTFAPGNASYLDVEQIGVLEYGAGKTAARLDTSVSNFAGEYLNMNDETEKEGYVSSCTVTSLRWESEDGINRFLSDGSFKPNTDYTLVLNIRMDEERGENVFYRLNEIVVGKLQDDGSKVWTLFSTDNETENRLEVENNGKTATVKLHFGNSGEINNIISVTPGKVSYNATEGFDATWAVNNSRTFTITNNSNDTYTNIAVSYGENTSDYFVLTAPAVTSLKPDFKTTFFVKLKTGIKAGNYSGSFNISFTGNDSKKHTKTVYVSAEVTDRDWYYISGTVLLPESMTDDHYDTTEVKLLNMDESSAGISTDVGAFEKENFTLSNVPKGSYIIRASRESGETVSKTIYVESDTTVTLDFTSTTEEEEETSNSGLTIDKSSAKPGDIVTASLKLIKTDKAAKTAYIELSVPNGCFELVSPMAFVGGNGDYTLTKNTEFAYSNHTSYTFIYTASNAESLVPSDTMTAQFRVLNTAPAGTAKISLGAVYTGHTNTSGTVSPNFFTDSLDNTSAELVIVSGGEASITGTVTSYGEDTQEVTIALYKEGEEIAAYSATATGNSASYSIADVAAGTYTMKVSKTKHATREYTVTVGGEAVTCDAKILLYGDIDGSGEIDNKDATQIKRYFNNLGNVIESTVDEAEKAYLQKVADVNSDGEIDNKDATQIKRFFNTLSSVFDSLD